MTSFGVTSAGFVLKTFEDIVADMETEAITQYGNDIDLTSTSPLKKFIDIVAAEQAILWQELEAAYYAGYLDSATGTNLDNLVALLGVVRQAVIKATGGVTFLGVTGTVIPANFEIQTAGSSPIVFRTDTSCTLVNGTYNMGITAKYGGISGNVAANTIIVVTSPISGLNTVINYNPTTGGVNAETDEEFRNRFKLSLSTAGAATLDAIVAGVINVAEVSSCSIEENDSITDNTPDGLPPKSFRVTVLNGDNDDIAQAIFDNKPAGIRSYGTSNGTAIASDGSSYLMYFRRPTDIQIYVTVVLTVGDTFPGDGLAQVENAIITYIGGTDLDGIVHLGLGIGEDVIFNKVVAAAMSIEGVSDAVVTIAKTPSPTGTSNISIAGTEKAGTTTSKVIVS